MPLYRYRAVSTTGEVAVGELDAANESEIVDRLRDRGLMPMQIAHAAGVAIASSGVVAAKGTRRRWFESKTVTRDQLLAVTRELATLLRAGLTLDRALEILGGLAPTPAVATMLQGIRDDVRGGKALSQALDARREVFSRFFVNIVRAGEAGGALGEVMQRLADTMERNKELRESVKSALIYPSLLVMVAVVSVAILLVFVVPQFESTFAQAGKALPVPTMVVVLIGKFMRGYWWALLGCTFLFVMWYRRRGQLLAVRRHRDGKRLRMPLLGDLLAKVETARFARTLATLLANGVTLLSGLAIVKETMTNTVMAEALDGVIAKLREGKGFGRPLAETGLYPRLATQMILVGEESGRLEEMLARVADVYDREVQAAIKRFLAVLEPALILSLAVLIGGIVFSILMGVMGMSELVLLSQVSITATPFARCRRRRHGRINEGTTNDEQSHCRTARRARHDAHRDPGRAGAARHRHGHRGRQLHRPGRGSQAQGGIHRDLADRQYARPLQARDRPLPHVAGRAPGPHHRAVGRQQLERPVLEEGHGAQGPVGQRIQVRRTRREGAVRHHLVRRGRQGRRRRPEQGCQLCPVIELPRSRTCDAPGVSP